MADRKTLYEGLGNAMWGFVLLGLDINLGTVSILPRFVGWLLLSSAAELLSEERRDLRLLKPLCKLMALWTFGDWLLSWTGGDIDGHVIFLDLLTGAASLYFHFQFLTDMAALARSHWDAGKEDLAPKFLLWRTVQTLLITAVTVCMDLARTAGGRAGEYISALATVLAVICGIAALAIVWNLLCLREWFKESPADDWTQRAEERLREEK